MSNISEQLKKLPTSPGVYKFLDKNKVILYIGKAASLKSRVGSYFRGCGNDKQEMQKGSTALKGLWSQRKLGFRSIKEKGGLDSRRSLPSTTIGGGNDRGGENDSKNVLDDRKNILVSQIHKIETIKTDSVLEALILEASLIKKYQPRFNVKLKDDKSFVNIVITDEKYATAQVGRPTDLSCHSRESGNLGIGISWSSPKMTKKSGMTFGPFPSAKMAREAVEILQKIFLFRTCKNLPKQKCLLYDIGQCSAPCIPNISPVEYKKSIKNLVLFLHGKKKSVIENLEREMLLEAKRENFERAARLRNQIFALNHIKDIALIKKSPLPPFSKGGKKKFSTFEKGGGNVEPHRIEAYDISNIGGKMAVGSMVVFLDGKVASDEYRKFKIKLVSSANDVAMMKEVLSRRLRHKEWSYPDLIIVDGGKPQYRAVCEVMAGMGIMLPVIAIAKGLTRKKADLIFSANAPRIDTNLIKQLRDEAHRFAIKYHRQLRDALK